MRARALLTVVLPVCALCSVLAAVNIWAYRHAGRIDLTSAGVYTIAPETRQILAQVEVPIAVTWFYDLRNKSMVDALALLEQYARENPNVTVRGIDPAVHPAEARRYGIQFAGSAVFESHSRTLIVNGGMETDFTNAIIRVSNDAMQTVCFTQGHAEGNPFSMKELDDPEDHDKDENLVARVEVHERHGMGMARDALETLGYNVRTVQLAKAVQGVSPLDGCSLTVVAGPKQAFRAEETAVLSEALRNGGKLLAMLEPERAHGLDAVLAGFGIRHDAREVVDEGSHYRSDRASPAVSDYPRHRITRNLGLTVFPGASSFVPVTGGVPSGVMITPLVTSSASSHPKDAASDRGARTLMLQATRRNPGSQPGDGTPQATIALIGDSDFATNSHYALLGNNALLLNTIGHLTEQERLIDIRPRHYESASVQLTNQQMRLSFFVSSVLLPLLAMAAALALWWRRR